MCLSTFFCSFLELSAWLTVLMIGVMITSQKLLWGREKSCVYVINLKI